MYLCNVVQDSTATPEIKEPLLRGGA